jgi:CRISPR/Cas system-associated endonuclease/helicase Cas3
VETGEFQSLKREAIKKGKTDVLILVIGSPIIETGRDFDFDFIITEPRDHRSLIQTGGRNYRHRNQAPPRPSFCVVNRSMKYFDENNTSRYYAWPGFEGQALSKKTKQNAPITDAFEDLFEFKNGDYLSAACVLQSTPDKGQTFKLAKKMEICSAEIFKKHDYSFSEFLKKSSQVLTNNAAKALPFRENTGFNTDTKLMLNANHEIDFDYEGLSQESVPIKFNRTSYKLGEFILLKETLIEIIEHYGFNIETYFDREVILTHSKNSEEFNEYIGTL